MLDATRRCDGKECGAQAYVFVDIGEHELGYCGHHGTKYWSRLHEVADRVFDFRYLIAEDS
jgi:hypothetical protein